MSRKTTEHQYHEKSRKKGGGGLFWLLCVLGAVAVWATSSAEAGPPAGSQGVDSKKDLQSQVNAFIHRREREEAQTHLKYGTPTPPPEWRSPFETLRYAAISFVFSDNMFCSGGLIDGNVIGRPDVMLIATAKHCVTSKNDLLYDPAVMSFTIRRDYDNANQLKVQIGTMQWGAAADPEPTNDFAVMAIHKGFLPVTIVQGALQRVDAGWNGAGGIVDAGFPTTYREELRKGNPQAANEPLIQVHAPKSGGCGNGFRHDGFSGPGGSGGPALNNASAYVGAGAASCGEVWNENDIALTNLTASARAFFAVAQEAVQQLDGQ